MNKNRKTLMFQYKRPRKFLGPSDIYTVLGLNRFESADELKNRIENGANVEVTTQQQSGIRDEKKCLALYKQNTKIQSLFKPKFIVDSNNPRFGGIADGLVDQDGGIEIKCQYRSTPPILYENYIVQSVGYMYLYKRDWWDVMVVAIDESENVNSLIKRIYWKDYEQQWTTELLPKITKFIETISWAR